MPARPMSRPTRLSRSICAFAALVIAPACGGPTAAGFRPGSGGSGGANNSGGSGDGSGGTAAGGGVGGPITDAGTDALGSFDGGSCADDAQAEPMGTAATGTFSGDGVSGAVCARGAFAYIRSTPADDGGTPRVELLIETTVNGSPAAALRFTAPADAVMGGINVDIGLPAARTGSYAQTATCGSVALFATLPTPDASVCATDAGDTLDCPSGCQVTGGLFDQMCTPIAPVNAYAALAADDCVGDSTVPTGSWTLTLSSITPYPADAGVGDTIYYAAHGTLTATLSDQQADGGAAGVSLSLTF